MCVRGRAVLQMGSTDSLDSGKDSAVDEQSPQHDGRPPLAATCKAAFGDGGRRRRGDKSPSTKMALSSSPSSSPSPPPVAAREHHNRSKSADCGGDGGDGSRRTHAKSLSLGDDSFDHKIQLWRKRADSQGSIDRPKPMPAARHHLQSSQADVKGLKGSGGAPDLVMDLPIRSETGLISVPATQEPTTATNTSGPFIPAPTANLPQEPDSPDMGTAAERFAKQNQCTLKKYSKPPTSHANSKPEIPPKSTKPPLKAKPQIFKKPVFLAPTTTQTTNSSTAASHASNSMTSQP